MKPMSIGAGTKSGGQMVTLHSRPMSIVSVNEEVNHYVVTLHLRLNNGISSGSGSSGKRQSYPEILEIILSLFFPSRKAPAPLI
jgi:hypothetical protein